MTGIFNARLSIRRRRRKGQHRPVYTAPRAEFSRREHFALHKREFLIHSLDENKCFFSTPRFHCSLPSVYDIRFL